MQKQIVLVMLRDGDKLSFKNDNVVVTQEGKIIHQSTCYKLFALVLVGHATLTSGLIARSKKFKFAIVMLSHGFRPYATINAPTLGNTILRTKQYHYDKLDIAKHLVCCKMDGQLFGLKAIRQKSLNQKTTIEKIKSYRARILEGGPLLRDEILGLEGIASRLYFASYFEGIDFAGRKPRAKQDKINVLLDMGYTLLFSFVEVCLDIYGFDTYKGVYHTQFYQRKSLVCDLVEPFRWIVDLKVKRMHNLSQVHPEDFLYLQGQYRLMGQNAKPYTAELLKAILKQKEVIFVYIRQYYLAFMKDLPIQDYPQIRGLK